MAYYNSYLALWEPLIEPVETIKDGKTTQSLWELQAEASPFVIDHSLFLFIKNYNF